MTNHKDRIGRRRKMKNGCHLKIVGHIDQHFMCKMWSFCDQTCGHEECPQMTIPIMTTMTTTDNSWLHRLFGIYAKWVNFTHQTNKCTQLIRNTIQEYKYVIVLCTKTCSALHLCNRLHQSFDPTVWIIRENSWQSADSTTLLHVTFTWSFFPSQSDLL